MRTLEWMTLEGDPSDARDEEKLCVGRVELEEIF